MSLPVWCKANINKFHIEFYLILADLKPYTFGSVSKNITISWNTVETADFVRYAVLYRLNSSQSSDYIIGTFLGLILLWLFEKFSEHFLIKRNDYQLRRSRSNRFKRYQFLRVFWELFWEYFMCCLCLWRQNKCLWAQNLFEKSSSLFTRKDLCQNARYGAEIKLSLMCSSISKPFSFKSTKNGPI